MLHYVDGVGCSSTTIHMHSEAIYDVEMVFWRQHAKLFAGVRVYVDDHAILLHTSKIRHTCVVNCLLIMPMRVLDSNAGECGGHSFHALAMCK